MHRLAPALLFTALLAGPARAVITDPTDTPPPTWTGRPDNAVIGRYASNASLVVVAPNYALTTTHQGGTNANVSIGGTTYYSTDLASGAGIGADLRIIKLFSDPARTTPANLPNYTAIYNALDDVGRQVAIGGYGRGTGTVLTAPGPVTYGYQWNNTSALRWGGNITEYAFASYPNAMIGGYFDVPGGPYSVPYEATIAEWDSGGGWFTQIGSTWAVLGLSRSVTLHGSPPNYQAWIRNPDGSPLATPDQLVAMRVSPYAAWIQSTVAADGGTVQVVPEPATLALLALGAPLVLRRRRGPARSA